MNLKTSTTDWFDRLTIVVERRVLANGYDVTAIAVVIATRASIAVLVKISCDAIVCRSPLLGDRCGRSSAEEGGNE